MLSKQHCTCDENIRGLTIDSVSKKGPSFLQHVTYSHSHSGGVCRHRRISTHCSLSGKFTARRMAGYTYYDVKRWQY
jgi:hypothetical protein